MHKYAQGGATLLCILGVIVAATAFQDPSTSESHGVLGWVCAADLPSTFHPNKQVVMALLGVQFLLGVFRNPISAYNPTKSPELYSQDKSFKGPR